MVPPKILIVDDDADVRDALKISLEIEGFAVDCAGNGAEALAWLAKNERPRFIILDLMMPVMNGWTFREEQLRDERYAKIPVVTLSGFASPSEAAAALQPDAYLRKPVQLDALLGVIDKFR